MNPQRFDITSQDFKRNPFPTFERMREMGPLVLVKLPIVGKVWLVTTYDATVEVLRDHERFVRDPRNAGSSSTVPAGFWWLPKRFKVLANNMLSRDGDDHRRLRGLVDQAFLRQSVEDMRWQIESLADHFLDELELAAAENETVDFIEHFARPLPLAVICELLGLPQEDRPKFTRWAQGITNATSIFGMFSAILGIWPMHGYLREQFRACREQPRPGLISALVAAEQEGDRLNEDELLSMAFLLLFAGHETTVYLISTGVHALLEHPEQKHVLMSDWSKAASAVEEVLRFVSPVQMTKPRIVREDMQLYGQQLRRGQYIMPLLASANSDPTQFSDPERFDISRSPNNQLSFGTGVHVCLGIKLARAEGEIAFRKIFQRFPGLKLASSDHEWTKRLGLRAIRSLPVTVVKSKSTSGSRQSETVVSSA